MAHTIAEKILARRAGVEALRPGDIAVVQVDRVVVLDMNFHPDWWTEPLAVFDPEKIVIVFDHLAPPPNAAVANAMARGRRFARRTGIERLHDVGADQGICHELIAQHGYARPGEILLCGDSHTCSAGALNCAARGIGTPEVIYALAKGSTWFEVVPTIRYDLVGTLSDGVTAKDLFFTIAARYGDHVGYNAEFGGPGLASLSVDARRTLTAMCAELSVEFAIAEPDEVLADFLRARGVEMHGAIMPDADASYAERRRIDLARVRPMVVTPNAVIGNVVTPESLAGTVITHAFVGSCANGTLSDIREVARIVDGRRVHPGVMFVVTPASQAIFREALREGLITTIADAGVLVTPSSCGMCAGFDNALDAGAVCITASTRNFQGRMGDKDARIFLGSPATVAASALAGRIVGERYA